MAPNMLGYSITSSTQQPEVPFVVVGVRGNATYIRPANLQAGSYWIVILSAVNPKQKVKEFVLSAKDHSTVPPGLDAYMSNPDYIFAVATLLGRFEPGAAGRILRLPCKIRGWPGVAKAGTDQRTHLLRQLFEHELYPDRAMRPANARNPSKL